MTRHGAAVPRGLNAAPSGRFGRLVDLDPCPSGPNEIEALVKVLDKKKGVKQSRIPAGFTYLGQFINHDITFDSTAFGAAKRDPSALVDFRTPRLDLDSVYGLGPDVQPYLYDQDSPGKLLLSLSQEPVLDLQRNDQERAVIGDPRNDENAIVSQLHLLFVRFHNRLVDELGTFAEARRVVLRHYHWIVLHEYLPKILGATFTGPRVHFTFTGDPFIPVEFSGAAFRFGHSMVRRDYGLRPLEEDVDPVLLVDLDGSQALTSGHEIFWGRFFPGLADEPPQFSGRIDTELSEALFTLPKGEPVLARRTLRRGVKLGLPSGQDLAEALGAPQLDEADLHLETVADRHTREALAAATPLWYWILCEAEKARGEHLGELGRTIVGEVLLGLIETDPSSYLVEDPDWAPGVLGGEKGAFPMASIVRFAQGGEPL